MKGLFLMSIISLHAWTWYSKDPITIKDSKLRLYDILILSIQKGSVTIKAFVFTLSLLLLFTLSTQNITIQSHLTICENCDRT